jgi:hypothetical protein
MIGYGRPTTICIIVRFFSCKLKQIMKSLHDSALAVIAWSERTNLEQRLDIDATKSYN